MKPDYTQLEILLITDSCYLRRELKKKDARGIPNQISYMILLEKACCEGLLPDLLPELFEKAGQHDKQELMQTRQGKSFIDIEIGSFPRSRHCFFALDPYSFMEEKCLN
jgi:DNA repair ATPase RecN